MKHLNGYKRRYYSLAVIAMYSTLFKLCAMDSNFVYHKYAYKVQEYKTSPPPSAS